MSKNEATLLLEHHLREMGLEYEREYKFDNTRKWRADFYIYPRGWRPVLIEIEGAVWSQGRHTRGSGFIADLEKYNTAAMLGYRLLRFSTQNVLEGQAREFIKKWLT